MAQTSLTVKTPTATTNSSSSKSLNTGGSVVDYIKSTGGDSSFSARAKQAVDLGIVKNASQYRGSASQNTSLLTKLRSGATKTPTAVATKSDAAAFINAQQDDDIATSEQSDAPPRRASEDLLESFFNATGKNSLVPDVDIEAPNFEATYEQLRKEFGIEGLEQSINEYDAQEQDIQARLRDRIDIEEGKPVALNVISGRVGEAEKQEFRRLDEIGRAKSRAINQLTNANNAIETKMTLKEMDYNVAKDEYNREFTQTMQLFTTFKGLTEFDISVEDKEKDEARANLQIMYGSIQDGGLDVNNLDASTESKITSLELKAGLPSGFYTSIAKSNPEGKVLSTTTRETGGVKYADVIMQNPDGSFTTNAIKLGAAKTASGSTSVSESQLARNARSEMAGALNTKAGSDGYVAPTDYKTARNAWVTQGFSAKDFNESFAREYVNPDHYDEYGVSFNDVSDL